MRYSDDVKRFIADNVNGKRISELTDAVNTKFDTNFTSSKMKSYIKNHGLKTGMPTKVKGEGVMFPEEVISFINNNYKNRGHRVMANLVNKTLETDYTDNQIKGYYGRNKLNSGLTGHFQKGHVPINKGKKGVCGKGCEKTWFKKGNIPNNYRNIGSERVNVDGYTEIKVSDPNKWKLKHNVVWEKHNGKVPKGYCVIFGDGNKSHIDIDNLILVSRKQLMILNNNHLIQKNVELTKVGIVIADVKSKMNERKKVKND